MLISEHKDGLVRGCSFLRGRRSMLTVLSALLVFSLPVGAQNYVWKEYRKQVEGASNIQAVNVNGAFGERVSLYTGEVTFAATDVSLPGNNALPVAFSRKLVPQTNPTGTGPNDLMGNWSIDLPRLRGTYPLNKGWQRGNSYSTPVGRCSSGNLQPPLAEGRVIGSLGGGSSVWDANWYWGGDFLDLPGGGSEEMLGAISGSSNPNPTFGGPYPWLTKSGWRFSCLPSTKNSTGEAFLGISPEGVRYFFDWVAKRAINDVRQPAGSTLAKTRAKRGDPGLPAGGVYTSVLDREEVYFLPSRVEDRFGNYINYQYDGNRLTAIVANDGRRIDIAYDANGRVATVGAAGRTWTYAYSGAVLQTVTLPDGSSWQYGGGVPGPFFSYYENADGTTRTQDEQCDNPPPFSSYELSNDPQMTVKNPSGATGVFTFRAIRHGRSYVQRNCIGTMLGVNSYFAVSFYPYLFDSHSLISKKVSGPGVPDQMWAYSYGPANNSWASQCASGCAATKYVDETMPDGRKVRHIFSNRWKAQEGKELQTLTYDALGALVSTSNFTYLGDAQGQGFAQSIGIPLNSRGDGTAAIYDPLVSTDVTADGVTYRNDVQVCGGTTYCFNEFAQPTKIKRWNTLGFSRVDVTEYEQNFGAWVLGQTKRTYNVDAGGVVYSETGYNAQALPIWTKKFGKLQQTLTYNADGTVATVADGNGNVTSLSGWKRGIPGLVSYPATPESPTGATQAADIDDNGWIRSVVDQTGAKTCYAYDAMGRIASVTYPSETQTGVCDASRWNVQGSDFMPLAAGAWMPAGISPGQWVQRIWNGSYRKITYMDALWRPVLVHEYDDAKSGTLRATRITYDASGRVNFTSYPSGDLVPGSSGTRTFYDALDRVTRVEQDSESGVLATTTEYLPGLKTKVTNPRGFATTTSFMAWDQPTYDFPIRSDQPENKVIEITRHPQFGWPLQLTQRSADNAISMTRKYVYDSNAQLCKTIEPETGVAVIGYDGAGNMTWQAQGLSVSAYGSTTDCQQTAAFGSGLAATREYDAHNRLTKLNFPGGLGNQIWTYEKDNLPTSVTAYNSANNTIPVVTSYVYNKRRMLVGESLGQPGWYNWGVGYNYDNIGNLRWQSYPDGLVIDYAPNALGQATQAVDGAAKAYATAATYYPNGALKQFTYGNGIVHTMTQNARQLPARVTSSGGVNDFSYNYDQNGNIANILDLARGDNYSRWMTYDNQDRLTSVGSCAFGGDCWHRFTYDALDNMKSWKLAGVKDYADYIYDQNNRLTSIRNTAGATVVGIGYDAQGNLQNKNGQTYEFDYGNRLRGATGKEYYRYDGLGRRVLNWRYPSGSLSLSQYTQSGQLVYQWDDQYPKYSENIYLSGSVIAIRDIAAGSNAVTVKYQHTDALGSPVAVTNEAGAVIERNDYEPYGAIIGKPAYNGIGYTGHMMDGATSLTYMQQRYYDESIGRFLSVDPVAAKATAGGGNLYRYAHNNPYRFIDPDGRDDRPWWDIPGKMGDWYVELQQIAEGSAYAHMAGTGDSAKRYDDALNEKVLEGGMFIISVQTLAIPEVGPEATSILKGGGGWIEAAAQGGCSFDEATLVQTEHGFFPIQSIKVGDRVLAKNIATGVESYEPVTAVFANWHPSTLTLRISNGREEDSIITSNEHPFYVVNRGFVRAASLRIGDRIELSENRSAILIEKAWGGRRLEFNLAVANDHTFFVEKFKALVHNSCFSKLFGQLLGESVAKGHAFEKHVLVQGEFAGLGIRTRAQFAAFIEAIVQNPGTEVRYARDGTMYFLDDSTRTIVIAGERGEPTAFRPRRWFEYLSTQVPSATTPP